LSQCFQFGLSGRALPDSNISALRRREPRNLATVGGRGKEPILSCVDATTYDLPSRRDVW